MQNIGPVDLIACLNAQPLFSINSQHWCDQPSQHAVHCGCDPLNAGSTEGYGPLLCLKKQFYTYISQRQCRFCTFPSLCVVTVLMDDGAVCTHSFMSAFSGWKQLRSDIDSTHNKTNNSWGIHDSKCADEYRQMALNSVTFCSGTWSNQNRISHGCHANRLSPEYYY